MYFISARRLFWYSGDVAAADEIRWIEPAKLHKDVALADLQVALAGKRVLLLVHGYNNEAVKTLWSYRTCLRGLAEHAHVGGVPCYDVVLGYLWPGEWRLLQFPAAVQTAESLGGRMNELLAALVAHATVDVCAHSLGNRVVLTALAAGGVRVRNVFALAPAVERDALGVTGRLRAAADHCEQLFVLHSRRDYVLGAGSALYEPRVDLGLTGPPTPDDTADSVHVVDSEALVTGSGFGTRHDQYRKLPQTYDLMARASWSRPGVKRFGLHQLGAAQWA